MRKTAIHFFASRSRLKNHWSLRQFSRSIQRPLRRAARAQSRPATTTCSSLSANFVYRSPRRSEGGRISMVSPWTSRRQQDPKARTDRLSHRCPGILRGHHVGARNPRLHPGHCSAAGAEFRARRHQSARRGSADCRSRGAAWLSGHGPDRAPCHHRRLGRAPGCRTSRRCGARYSDGRRIGHSADAGCRLRNGAIVHARRSGHRWPHDQLDRARSRPAGLASKPRKRRQQLPFPCAGLLWRDRFG